MPTSPDVRNISVGRGYIEFKPEGDSVYRHVGNVPTFTFTISGTSLDHYSPVDGIIVKDYSWTVQQEAEVSMVMEEITAQNLALLMLGDVTAPGGVTHVTIQARSGKSGALKYTATNEVGPRWHIDLWSVTFNDGGEYSPITKDDFNAIPITGKVLAVGGVYGEMTQL